MMKPLKELLQQADSYLGTTKVASPVVVSDEVSSLANTLAFAERLEQQFTADTDYASVSADEELEKVAKQINKIAAQAEIEVLATSEAFREKALGEGYTEDQIDEALSKIAAQRIKKNLGALTAIGVLPVGFSDVNSLNSKQPVKAVGEEKRRLPLTHSARGAT